MARLKSRAELAHLAGVSRAAITKACKTQLASACVDDRVDVDARCVVDYLARKGVVLGAKPAPKKKVPRERSADAVAEPANTRRPPLPPAQRAQRPDSPELDVAGYSDELAELTVKQVVDRWGTVRAYKDWLEAHEKRERARKNYLDNEETEGSLISRDLVKSHVMDAIDAVLRRLLQDTPKTVSRRLYAAAKSGQSIEEAESIVRELISSQLRPMKENAARQLRNA